MLRIFDRYLLKEVIYGWLAVTVVLWLVLVSNRLVQYLAEAAEGNIPGSLIFNLLALKMVWYLVLVVPFALALGVVLGLSRLYRDNEMVVMSACGVGPARIYRPLLGLSMIVAVLIAWLSLYVSPTVQGMSDRLKVSAQQQADLTVLGAGRFNDLQGGRVTFYAERLSADRSQMENLFIVVRSASAQARPPQLLTAKTARRTLDGATGEDFLVLQDGYRYDGTPGEASYRIMQFSQYGVRIDLPDAADPGELREAVATRRLLASSDPWDIAELQWRLSMPLSVIVLVLLAVPLTRGGPRQGRYGRLVMAVLLFVVYYNLLGTAKVWVGKGAVPPEIGLWWVPVLPVILTLLLY
ncbi:MAG TPA: LPS export ABC transporter permease LptF, partial [Gammaproteobacteria bacterium]|nr:LPS export ABC transporter permease LptF [Gammaproteobacteria bacterium]